MELILIIAILLIADIILIWKVKRNKYILNKKDTQGIIINAKVIGWDNMVVATNRYLIKVEYETDGETKIKTFLSGGRFAKKYKKEKSIQIVIISDTGKVYLEEEDWKRENIIFTIIITGVTFILIGCLLVGIVMINEGNQKYTYSNNLGTEYEDEQHPQMPKITNIIIKENKCIALCEDKSIWIWNKSESKDKAVLIDKTTPRIN